MHIKVNSLEEALVTLGDELLCNSTPRETRGFKCFEYPEPVMVTINDPTQRYIYNKERGWNKHLGFAESIWLLNGVNSMDMVGKVVKNLYNFSDDGQFMRACLVGDTKIKLLNGEDVKIKDLVGLDEFWVYSKDEEGRVVAGRGHSASITKTVNKLIKLTLDNGEEIISTEDHKIRLLDGRYKPASEINFEDRLSPYYDNIYSGKNKWLQGYHQIMDDNGDWVFTHQRVAECISKDTVNGDNPQIHHIDYNKLNNSPDNLIWLSNADHRRVHADHGRRVKKEMMDKSIGFKEMCDDISRVNAKRATEVLNSHLENNTPTGLKIRKIRSNTMSKMNSDPEIQIRAIQGRVFNVFDLIKNNNEVINEFTYVKFKRKGCGLPNVKKVVEMFGSFEEAIKAYKERRNHKIIKTEIIELQDEIEVYDISVDKYHNFALASGVFVHNSYGPRIRSFSGVGSDYTNTDPDLIHIQNSDATVVDQLKYIIELLHKDINTRQASITIHDPAKDCFNSDGTIKTTKDQPCTRLLQFMVVDGKLDMTTYMRSNDFLWGFSAVNIFNFTFMQEIVANMIGVEVGRYHHVMNNIHYYENFRDKIKGIVNIKPVTLPTFKYEFKTSNFNEFDVLLKKAYREAMLCSHNKNPYYELQLTGEGILDDALKSISQRFQGQREFNSSFTNPLINRLFDGK